MTNDHPLNKTTTFSTSFIANVVAFWVGTFIHTETFWCPFAHLFWSFSWGEHILSPGAFLTFRWSRAWATDLYRTEAVSQEDLTEGCLCRGSGSVQFEWCWQLRSSLLLCGTAQVSDNKRTEIECQLAHIYGGLQHKIMNASLTY